jgi:WD40 repeat protein
VSGCSPQLAETRLPIMIAAARVLILGLLFMGCSDSEDTAKGTGKGQSVNTGSFAEESTPRESSSLTGHTKAVVALALSLDGHYLLSGSGDTTARLWDLKTGALTGILRGHSDGIFDVALSGDAKVAATASGDRTVKVWDALNANLRATLLEGVVVYSLALSPDGKMIATGEQDKVRLWSTQNNELLAEFGLEEWQYFLAWHVQFTPDGNSIIGIVLDALHQVFQREGSVRVWNVAQKKVVSDVSIGFIFDDWPNRDNRRFGVTDDAALIAYWRGKRFPEIVMWDTRVGAARWKAEPRSGRECMWWGFAISSDKKRLATSGTDWSTSDQLVLLFDAQSGAEVGRMKLGTNETAFALAFHPGNKSLAGGLEDGSVRLWKLSDFESRK